MIKIREVVDSFSECATFYWRGYPTSSLGPILGFPYKDSPTSSIDTIHLVNSVPFFFLELHIHEAGKLGHFLDIEPLEFAELHGSSPGGPVEGNGFTPCMEAVIIDRRRRFVG